MLAEKQYSFNVSEHYVNFISTHWSQCTLGQVFDLTVFNTIYLALT